MLWGRSEPRPLLVSIVRSIVQRWTLNRRRATMENANAETGTGAAGMLRSTVQLASLLAALSLIACTKNFINPDGTNQPVPSDLAAVAGNNQVGAPGQPLPTPPAVRVSSNEGRPVKDVSVFFEARGGGTVIDGVARTDANGVAVAGKWILGPNPGQQTLTATLPGVATVSYTHLRAHET